MEYYPDVSRAATQETPLTNGKHGPPARSELLKAALEYAARGWPVFPCRAGGKEPLIRDWPNKASTTPSRITAWFNRWPDANVGVVTGERSGLLVLDVDHPSSLDALEAEHGELPETRTHATGAGGMHYLFAYPDGEQIPNSASKLGFGLDTRGEGGYIVAPPSRTTRPYEVLEELPLADPPAWLPEALRERQRSFRSASRDPSTREPGLRANVEGPAIEEGTRDDTLTSIAGALHDGSRTLEDLLEALLQINAARCEPPLPTRQVERIARSVYRYAPANKRAPLVSAEVLEALGDIEASHLWGREWPGKGGKTRRDVLVALLEIARKAGTIIPAGVRVSVSVRELALAAGVSKATLTRKDGALAKLKLAEIIRGDNAARSGVNAGAFVLLRPKGAHLTHSPTTELLRTTEISSGFNSRPPRLRWSVTTRKRIGDEEVVTVISRLGKSCGALIDALVLAGGSSTVGELAATLGVKKPSALRRRTPPRFGPLPLLEAAGVVECTGNNVTFTRDWREALERERERAGEIAAHERDAKRYAREREAYKNRHRVKPEPVPEVIGGEIRELEREADVIRLERERERREEARRWELYSMLEKRVRTARGPGLLWQVLEGEARVILDANPQVWIPLGFDEIREPLPEGSAV